MEHADYTPSYTPREMAYRQILEVTRKLLTPIDLDPLLAEIVEIACELHGADRASVFLYDPRADELYARVAKGVDGIRFPASAGIAGAAVQTREIINVPDCYADPRFNQDVDRKTSYRTNNLLTVPLVGDHESIVGVLQVLNKEAGAFDEHDEETARCLAVLAAVALSRALLVEDRALKQKMERDLAVASDIQTRILPSTIPQPAGYDIAGWSRPAEQTGGDVFDVIPVDDQRLALLLGDATGHGIGPALSVTQVRSMLRLGLRVGAGLDNIVQQINAQLTEDLPSNRFVTAFFGVLDASTHRLLFQSAGQAPLLHHRAADGDTDQYNSTSLPLGILDELRFDSDPVMALGVGDIVALISDGIFEYQNPDRVEFGIERVIETLARSADLGSEAIIESLRDEVEQYAGGAPQLDDMTMLIVKRVT